MGKKGWKDKQGWWNTKLNVLACYQRRCSVLSPWDWRLQEYTALLVGQTGLSVGTHPSWTTRKVTVARYSITGNVITNWEHWNPLHQILLHGMYHQGSNWNWIVSQHLEKRWWPCLQQVMEGYFHCINESLWGCSSALQPLTGPHESTMSFSLVTSVSIQWLYLLTTFCISSLFISSVLTSYIVKLLFIYLPYTLGWMVQD
jgi:hypothetical protein